MMPVEMEGKVRTGTMAQVVIVNPYAGVRELVHRTVTAKQLQQALFLFTSHTQEEVFGWSHACDARELRMIEINGIRAAFDLFQEAVFEAMPDHRVVWQPTSRLNPLGSINNYLIRRRLAPVGASDSISRFRLDWAEISASAQEQGCRIIYR